MELGGSTMNTLNEQDAATPQLDKDSRLIPLTQGKFAIVDEADFKWLNQWKWHLRSHNGREYAIRVNWKEMKHWIRMHRLIMNPPEGIEVDHRDGNGLNNRRRNLRLATHRQNSRNTKLRNDNKSGYRGVCWDEQTNRWKATINCDGKQIWLGRFDHLRDAAAAYNEAARIQFGEFAVFNRL
jgi:hypothetical protein